MTKKLVWRMGKLPTVEELRQLVQDKIITQEEAREVLFNLEEEEDRDKKSLESEIKFLRELVEKLSKTRSETITTIKEIGVLYRRWDWWSPYVRWCNNPAWNASITSGTYNLSADTTTDCNFSNIKTF